MLTKKLLSPFSSCIVKCITLLCMCNNLIESGIYRLLQSGDMELIGEANGQWVVRSKAYEACRSLVE